MFRAQESGDAYHPMMGIEVYTKPNNFANIFSRKSSTKKLINLFSNLKCFKSRSASKGATSIFKTPMESIFKRERDEGMHVRGSRPKIDVGEA